MDCKWINVSLTALSVLSSALVSSVPEIAVSGDLAALNVLLSAPALTPDKPINCCGRAVPGLSGNKR